MEPTLREQVMINQFVMAVGATREQARQLLQASHWQFETALSIFFQEAMPPQASQAHLSHLHTPANTPATPPAFPEALAAFSRMSTQDPKHSTSPPTYVPLTAAQQLQYHEQQQLQQRELHYQQLQYQQQQQQALNYQAAQQSLHYQQQLQYAQQQQQLQYQQQLQQQFMAPAANTIPGSNAVAAAAAAFGPPHYQPSPPRQILANTGPTNKDPR